MAAPCPNRLAATDVPVITFLDVADAPPAIPVSAAADPLRRPQKFVETDDRQVTGEKPVNTPFYSDRDTVAANPANPTGQLGDTPYLDGQQTLLYSTEDVFQPKPKTAPLAPAAAVPAVPEPPPVTPPVPPEPMMATSAEGLRAVEPPPPATATAQAPASAPTTPGNVSGAADREIVARKTQLTTSGVARIGVAAFNVAASPFGEYDKKIVRAVQSRWFALIDRNDIYERSGTVTVRFALHSDGAVRALQREENTAGEILALFCEKAILESAPFDPFPEPLRLLVGNEPRIVSFTFYY